VSSVAEPATTETGVAPSMAYVETAPADRLSMVPYTGMEVPGDAEREVENESVREKTQTNQ
jgi:hypothetical protein